MNIDGWLQLGVAVFGVSAILLVSLKRREGFIIGLCAQPFWFTICWRKELWGIFVLCFFYAASWGIGVWNHYLRRAAAEGDE